MSSLSLSPQQSNERFSVLAVLLLLLLSLLVGWGVKTAVQSDTNPITVGAVTAEVPQNWLTNDGIGDLVLVARNPFALNQRYRIRVIEGNQELAAAAAAANFDFATLNSSFRILEQTPIVVDGRDSYQVRYAYVDDPESGSPQVIEGVDYYFSEPGNVLIISYEAEQSRFDAGFAEFQAFRSTVRLGGGS